MSSSSFSQSLQVWYLGGLTNRQLPKRERERLLRLDDLKTHRKKICSRNLILNKWSMLTPTFPNSLCSQDGAMWLVLTNRVRGTRITSKLRPWRGCMPQGAWRSCGPDALAQNRSLTGIRQAERQLSRVVPVQETVSGEIWGRLLTTRIWVPKIHFFKCLWFIYLGVLENFFISISSHLMTKFLIFHVKLLGLLFPIFSFK